MAWLKSTAELLNEFFYAVSFAICKLGGKAATVK